MKSADDADELFELAYQVAADLAEDIRARDYRASRPTQLARLLFVIQGNDGQDGMLWLCQQFADEIVSLAAAKTAAMAEVAK